jgi:hypothetical protein
VKYEVDWSAESADWKSSTPHTIQGVSWGAINAGNGGTISASSDGLQIQPNTSAKFQYNQVDAPGIAARVELLAPGWDALDTLAFQAIFTSSATLSHEDVFGFVVGTGANPDTAGAMFYTVRQIYNSGVKDSLAGAHTNSSEGVDYASTSGGSMMELTLFPGGGASALISGSEFVDPLTATSGYKAFGTMTDLRAIGPTGALSLEPGNTGSTDAFVQIYAGRGSSTSGYTATMSKFRVLAKKRSL